MTDKPTCPKCGAMLPENAPSGICPKCLMGAAIDSADESIESPFAATTPQLGGFDVPAPAALQQYFSQLVIHDLIGQGGMGAVYLARQTKLDRLVALKIMRPESRERATFAERFHREARTLARLNHPNIVAIHDFGEVSIADPDKGSPTTLYYFVMEYVDGANLRQLIDAGDLEPAEALAIIPQICEALQFAHDEGIVHRDIKPENVLLDRKGRVKIADFGLAKLSARTERDQSLTGTYQVMGTPRYMAPEQMQGSHGVDHRADIYSLGVVFYEMLTGEVPAGHFDPPSKTAELDIRLDDVVLRSLAREPDRRYQHASDLKIDVDSIARSDAALNASHSSFKKLISTPAALTLDGEAMGSAILRFDGSTLTLEYELSEDDAAWFEGSEPHYPRPCKPGHHEVTISLSDIAAVQFERKWRAGQIRITTHNMQALADVPGSDQATVTLAVAKENIMLATQLVTAVDRCLKFARERSTTSRSSMASHERPAGEDQLDDKYYEFDEVVAPLAMILGVFAVICFAMWLSSSPIPLWGLLLIPPLARIVPMDCVGYRVAGAISLVCGGCSLGMMQAWTQSNWHAEIFSIVIFGMLWFAVDHFWSSEEEEDSTNDSEPESKTSLPANSSTRLSLFRRLPIPAWIALLLFVLVYIAAIVEWSGQGEVSSRGNGVLFYLLGTGVVIVWGAFSYAARLLRSAGAEESSPPTARKQLAVFFAVLVSLTGGFVWQWAELGSQRGRDTTWAFLFGYGSIILELPSSDVEVVFNDQPVQVPDDGMVALPLDEPGSYVVAITDLNGSVHGGEQLIKAGATISSGILADAVRVVVTGPIRGSLPASANSTKKTRLAPE